MRIAVYKTILDPIYTPIDIFTYVLYVADVLINFRTTYRDSYGKEVKDSRKIFWNYTASFGFWIDLLSLLNYPMGSNPVLNCIGILKVNRMLRIYNLINESNFEKGKKILLLIWFYYLVFVIYLHIIACLWFLMIEMTYMESLMDPSIKVWEPPYDSHIHEGDDNIWTFYENEQHWLVYWICLYYSVMVIGGNDLMPMELREMTFAVIINLTGSICYVYIIGEISVLIVKLGSKSSVQ